ncbi:MAG: glycosyltransferase family 2 protein [Chloroflexi bacterium]|nr:glycosyltransferase family 2 protein [Chloroflexota bacterium]
MPLSVRPFPPPLARVSVIIPNWNGAHLLPTCLRALEKQTFHDFEIVVVDNASRDDSRALLARDFPAVRVLPLDVNRFFAGAVNHGIRATQSEIVVLLNNDTEAEATWLQELLRAFDAQPRAGMAATKLRLFDAREKLHSAGDFYRVDGVPGNRGVWQVDAGQYDDPHLPPPLFGVCGGACAYRRAMLDEIGLFDEDLEFNCEDVDLNWRARLAGYACAFAPRAIVYHQVSASGGGKFASFYVGRNFIAVLARNYPGGLWKKYWRAILSAQWAITRDALKAWRGEAARARLRGQLAGILSLPRALRKRRAVQALKRVDDEEIEKLLAC